MTTITCPIKKTQKQDECLSMDSCPCMSITKKNPTRRTWWGFLLLALTKSHLTMTKGISLNEWD
jgi:hypothetical protein